jgi:alkyl hydroperoxide reductase subunit AhpF
VYAATLKMEALLVAKDLGGQAVDSTKIENYLEFDFITGPELIDKFKHHLLQSHYIEHLMSLLSLAPGPFKAIKPLVRLSALTRNLSGS